MKGLLLIIILAASALTCRAQTVAALADSSFAHQDYLKAFNYYSQVAKSNPKDLIAFRRRAFCMMNFEGREMEASRLFDEALKINPKDPASNYYKGIILKDAAKQEINKAAKSEYKAQAAKFLNLAALYGNPDAKGAMNELNGI